MKPLAPSLPRSIGRVAFAAVLAGAFAAPTTVFAIVYGLESEDGPPALSTQLFSFEESGSAVTVIGDVTVGGADIDADALAQSFTHGLRAYRLLGTSSQLISIDPLTGDAAHIGSALANRSMRAAAFDALGRLWVVDAANSVLLRIDPVTGAVLGSPIALTLGMNGFTIASASSDIAFQATGSAVLVNDDAVYSLDTATGAVTLLFEDTALQGGTTPVFHVGAAFVAGVGAGKLFVFEANGTDDVFYYQNLSPPRVLYDEDFSPGFNAGRGDLASLPPVLAPGELKYKFITSTDNCNLGDDYTVTAITDVASISDGGYMVYRFQANGPGSDDPSVICRATGAPNSGVVVARIGQSVAFPDGNRPITFFEAPIVDDAGNVAFTANLDVGRGLVVWESASQTLIGAARTGQAVNVTCDTIIATPCGDGGVGDSVAGTLTNIAAFQNRVAASFEDGRALFVGAMNVTAGGVANAVWTWDLATETLTNVANSRQLADGDDPAPPHPFYQTFTHVASCEGELYGVLDVSQGAPAAVYEFHPSGAGHTLLERGYRPESITRVDFHCSRENWGYAGTYSAAQGDNATARRGIWVDTQQVYSFGVTAFPGGAATTLGNQLGQALLGVASGNYRTVFASKLTGGTANGKSGVFIDGSAIALSAIAYETQAHAALGFSIEKIYTATVSASGHVGLFIQKRDSISNALSDALVFWDGTKLSVLSKVGDAFPQAGVGATITGFRMLGRDFFDTKVTGTGQDGHLNAMNASDWWVYQTEYTVPTPVTAPPGDSLVPRGSTSGVAITLANLNQPALAGLDVDANAQVQPLKDGLLLLRHLFGLSGNPLINGAVGDGCTRCLADDITAYLDGIESQLDVDGNNSVLALSDGLLVVRYLFGFTGETLTDGAVGEGCTRCESGPIVTFLNGLD